jgi:Tfp pilus assembly PilM family ATPase
LRVASVVHCIDSQLATRNFPNMFAFVQNIFAPPAHPIGVDFGIGTLRMAQVQSEGDDFKLLAAASAEVPADILATTPTPGSSSSRRRLRNLLVQGKFHGRRAVLGLPSSVVHIQHLTLDHC